MNKAPSVMKGVRLDDAELAEVIHRLNGEEQVIVPELRKDARYRFELKRAVLHIQGESGAPASFLVPTRDISTRGIGLLHGGFIYPGAKCVIQLTTLHGTWQNVPAQIVRCAYVSNGIHDVGARLLEPIDPSDFCAEAAPCRILTVDDSEFIRRLVKTMLGAMNAECDDADSGAAALELASDRIYDVVLMDMEMPGMDGFETVSRLRAQGYSGTIVALTGMCQPGDQQRCVEAGCDDYIPKPFDRERLTRLIATLRQEPLLSTICTDRAMQPLIDGFVDGLPERVRMLESVFANNSLPALVTAVRSLKADSGGVGFDPISAAAAEFERSIKGLDTLLPVKEQFRRLIRICANARPTVRQKAD